MKNVILLTIDTLRKDVLGCYDNKEGLTPFLDSLIDKLIIYTNHLSAGPYTQASFPGILTSSYFLEFGNPQHLSAKRTLISEIVKNGGFTTAAFHSNPYLCDFFGWNRSWDIFYDSMQDEVSDMFPYIKGDVINKKVFDWLSNYTEQSDPKPFFLWAHYMDVHEPYVPDKKYIDKVNPSIDLTPEQMFAMFEDVILPRDVSDPEKVKLLKELYNAHVVEVDEYTREFFDSLQKLNLLDNTIVIITTDHGDEFGDHGHLSHDGRMYSELINVPLLIYHPELSKEQTIDKVVSGVDISPTIAHLFRLEMPGNFHGQSLLPTDDYVSKGAFGEAVGKLAHKVKETDRPAHFYQEGNLRISHCIEDDKWQLYDLSADPVEKSNIIESSPAAEDMKNKLREKITWHDQGDKPVITVTEF